MARLLSVAVSTLAMLLVHLPAAIATTGVDLQHHHQVAEPPPLPDDKPLDYFLLEELPVGTVVGNVPRDFRLGERYNPPAADGSFHFRFLQATATVSDGDGADGVPFEIDRESGVVRTTTRIDRDALCQDGGLLQDGGGSNNVIVSSELDDRGESADCLYLLDVIVQPMR